MEFASDQYLGRNVGFSSCENPEIAAHFVHEIPLGIDESELILLTNNGELNGLCELLAPEFDKAFGDQVDYGKLVADDIDETEKLSILQSAIAGKYPIVSKMPLYARRYARYYMGTVVASVRHIAESIIDESAARTSESPDILIPELLGKAILLRDILATHTDKHQTISDEELVQNEIGRNYDQLQVIAALLGEMTVGSEVSIGSLMTLQPALWGSLTSNRVHLLPDVNYRREVNSKPKTHHSLFPVSELPLSRASSSQGEYVSFIEAVSANDHNGFASTLGFMHIVVQDDSGVMRMVEYPVSMIDHQIIDRSDTSENITNAILAGESLPTNHDLWHNLIPVFAEGFILHHPDAPISYGGLRDAYHSFGERLRRSKEEYEIGVAMGHSNTMNYLYETNLHVRESLHAAVDSVFDNLAAELHENPENALVVDYLAVLYTSRLLKIFSADHPIYNRIISKLEIVAPLPEVVTATSCVALMFDQGLYDSKKVRSALEGAGYKLQDKSDEDIYQLLISQHPAASTVFLNVDVVVSIDSQSGAHELYEALEEIGILQQLSESGAGILNGLDKIRWLSIIGPQRRQLRGHMEKVYGKKGVQLGDLDDVDPTTIIGEQFRVLAHDRDWYESNIHDRNKVQRITKSAYDITIGHSIGSSFSLVGEQLHSLASSEMYQTYFDEFMESIDIVIDSFVELDFNNHSAFLASIDTLLEVRAAVCSNESNLVELGIWITEFTKKSCEAYFSHLCRQSKSGICFRNEREQLLSRVMSL